MRETNQKVHMRKAKHDRERTLDAVMWVAVLVLIFALVFGFGTSYQYGYEVGYEAAEVHKI